jgi:hypothetical protein
MAVAKPSKIGLVICFACLVGLLLVIPVDTVARSSVFNDTSTIYVLQSWFDGLFGGGFHYFYVKRVKVLGVSIPTLYDFYWSNGDICFGEIQTTNFLREGRPHTRVRVPNPCGYTLERVYAE